MKLAANYQAMIDQVMTDKVEGWRGLSPLDPTKMILSGVIGSLGKIEERQARLANQMLSLFPSFMGFEVRSGQGQSFMIQFRARPDLNIPITVDPPFRFQALSGITKKDILFNRSIDIVPIDIKSSETYSSEQFTEMKITMHLRAPIEQMELLWHAPGYSSDNGDDAGSAGKIIQAQARFENKTWHLGELRVQDNTFGLSGSGSILLGFSGTQSRTFAKGELEVQLRWENPIAIHPHSEIRVNSFVGHVVDIREWCQVGKLMGDAWEEILLPGELIEVPDEVLLELPSGGNFKLKKANEELLRVILGDPQELKTTFLYNSVRHSLTFPAGHLLVGDFTGGLPVIIKQAVFQSPACEKLKCDSVQVNTQETKETLTLEAIAPLQAPLSREKDFEVLSRFHASIRAYHLGTSRDLDLQKIRSALFSGDSRVRGVELDLDSTKKSLTAVIATESFLDSMGKETGLTPLPSDLVDQMGHIVASLLPLDYSWRISPFRKLELQFGLKITHSSRVTLTRERIEKGLADLLSPNVFLLEGASKSKKKFEGSLLVQELFKNLKASIPGIVQVDGVVVRQSTGEYLDVLTRKPGIVFSVRSVVDFEEREEY